MIKVSSREQFARICCVTRNAVDEWIRRELISGKALVGEGRDLMINTVEALRQLKVTLDPGQSSGKGAKRAAAIDRALDRLLGKKKTGRPTGKLTIAAQILKEKNRGLKARANLAELQVAMQAGALIPMSTAKDYMSEFFIAFRQSLLHMITRFPNTFPYLSPRDHLALDRLIREQMRTTVDELEAA